MQRRLFLWCAGAAAALAICHCGSDEVSPSAAMGPDAAADAPSAVTPDAAPIPCEARAGAVPVDRFGAFVPDAAAAIENTDTLQAALDAVGADGGGTVCLPSGQFALGHRPDAGSAVVYMRHDHVALQGAGVDRTGLHTPGEYRIEGGNVQRAHGVLIEGTTEPTRPRVDIALRDFELEGGAGWTGNHGWPADPTTGDGWDITHKGIITSFDTYVDGVVLERLYVHRYRGEVLYTGGLGMGNVSVSRVRVSDSNAQAINLHGRLTIEDSEFDHVNLFAELSARFADKSTTTIRRNHFHDATHNGIVIAQGDLGELPFLFEDNVIERAPYGFMFTGGVGGPVMIRRNAFREIGTGLMTTWAPNADSPWNEDITLENNTFESSGMLANFLAYVRRTQVVGNTFVGKGPTANEATAMVYGAVTMEDVVVRGNRFRRARSPEQSASVTGSRPLFLDNVYEDIVDRDAQGMYVLFETAKLVTPHHERLVLTNLSGGPAEVVLETTGYPNGQRVSVTGGTTDKPVRFVASATSYSVPETRLLVGGTSRLVLRFDAQAVRWIEETYAAQN